MLGPLTVIMLLSGLIRHYVTQLLNSPPKKQQMLVVREQCVHLSPASPPDADPTGTPDAH